MDYNVWKQNLAEVLESAARATGRDKPQFYQLATADKVEAITTFFESEEQVLEHFTNCTWEPAYRGAARGLKRRRDVDELMTLLRVGVSLTLTNDPSKDTAPFAALGVMLAKLVSEEIEEAIEDVLDEVNADDEDRHEHAENLDHYRALASEIRASVGGAA